MSLNTAVMFGKATDEWATPRDFFAELQREFDFLVDLAATRENRLCPLYVGPDNAAGYNWQDYLTFDTPALMAGMTGDAAAWMNPPYSKCREFIAKAACDAQRGCTVVALVPSRTDTRWFHQHVYNRETLGYRPGVTVRFVKGRLKFGGVKNSAPFPSMLIVFRPCDGGSDHV